MDISIISSESTYKNVIFFFKFYILANGLSFIVTLFGYIPNAENDFIVNFLQLADAIVLVISGIGSIIVYLIWLYKFHHDVRKIDTNYSIGRGGALARFLIPVYSLWGIWNIHSEFSEKLKRENDTANKLGFELSEKILPFFVLFIISNFFGKLLFKDTFRDIISENTENIVTIISSIVDIILYVIWIQMITIMNSGLAIMFRKETIK